jgi:hypothetical protein
MKGGHGAKRAFAHPTAGVIDLRRVGKAKRAHHFGRYDAPCHDTFERRSKAVFSFSPSFSPSDQMIRDDADLERHVDYVHFNPVKHGHVARVADWPHSSFHRDVERGLLAEDWGGDMREIQGSFGE